MWRMVNWKNTVAGVLAVLSIPLLVRLEGGLATASTHAPAVKSPALELRTEIEPLALPEVTRHHVVTPAEAKKAAAAARVAAPKARPVRREARVRSELLRPQAAGGPPSGSGNYVVPRASSAGSAGALERHVPSMPSAPAEPK